MNRGVLNAGGDFVCYWMSAARRLRFNFALQRAAIHARSLGKPLLILEDLRCDNEWDSDRHHAFVLQGMAQHAATLKGSAIRYYPFVAPGHGGAEGMLATVARRACVIVADEFPCLSHPAMLRSETRALPVLVEAVDGNGLLPLFAAQQAYPTAYAFRRFLQRELPGHLTQMPDADPLAGLTLPALKSLPAGLEEGWPAASGDLLAARERALARLPIDHRVPPVATQGGARAARERLSEFLSVGLPQYPQLRNHPDEDATSGLSPYLHAGHLSVHEVLTELGGVEGWTPEHVAQTATGGKSGWWGMGEPAEAFLDELVTWREVGFNFCHARDDYDLYESLPDWAQMTLAQHADDPRPYRYTPDDLEAAATHDPLWNAAQRQLLREGRIHSYLRMLWGKKVLQWSESPQEATRTLIELNNKWALDGRDPNSYSGIFWCLGRYDRPWGPQRPIFGTVRYMSSENTARKLRVRRYLDEYGPGKG
jgi:deoxyribodipyrimidine photo-lyase